MTDKSTRYCDICGDEIPRESKDGKLQSWHNYSRKTTCGEQACYIEKRRRTALERRRIGNGDFTAGWYYVAPDIAERFCRGL